MNLYPVIIGAMILGGLAISLWGWRVIVSAQKVKQWPGTEGRIEVSEPTSEIDDLLPHIVFSYRVNTNSYRKVFEFPPGTNPMPEFADAYVKKYPVGATVQVYYNPQNPEQATLEPNAQGDWMILALGVLMTVVGVGAYVLA